MRCLILPLPAAFRFAIGRNLLLSIAPPPLVWYNERAQDAEFSWFGVCVWREPLVTVLSAAASDAGNIGGSFFMSLSYHILMDTSTL